MYSYDVPSSSRRPATASRAIPGMRPSYDAEHPHSATPIYDELYSEYRRLFRALPGDRSGEEDLTFTGFAVRDTAPARTEPRPYPPQHQAFQTYAGQPIGIPQFVPGRPGGPDHGSAQPDQPAFDRAGHGRHGEHAGHGDHDSRGGHPGHPTGPQEHSPAPHAGRSGGAGRPAGPYTTGFHPAPAPGRPAGAQAGTGQGWVASGYLGAAPPPVAAHVPAPPPVTVPVPAPAPAVGAAFGHADPGPPGGGGRHRSLLSLPPGRNGEQH
ncbi:hypothetical protein ACFVUH_32570 [Kitasatospora sp. NPDC058032]|uniref:hypothetical protein n=1 Tax=Kitasatospora sp. NPDC058032 TaxID=3346307 RepID=UPI0036DBA367